MYIEHCKYYKKKGLNDKRKVWKVWSVKCQKTLIMKRHHLCQKESLLPFGGIKKMQRINYVRIHLKKNQVKVSHSHWYKLVLTSMWYSYCKPELSEGIGLKQFYAIRNSFINDQFRSLCAYSNSSLLLSCRSHVDTDPILWLPLTKSERSHVFHWRPGWLTGGNPHWMRLSSTSELESSTCFWMFKRPPSTILDPTFFLLNMLPTHKPRRRSDCLSWPILVQYFMKLTIIFMTNIILLVLILAGSCWTGYPSNSVSFLVTLIWFLFLFDSFFLF